MILIAESGSTKCDWVLLDLTGKEIERWKTIGFNPYFHAEDVIVQTLSTEKDFMFWKDKVSQVWFYGAGCSTEVLSVIVRKALDRVFVNSSNNVGHDLEAAAFALYQGEPFVACILGTGSNSCMFDGDGVYEETPSLAYVLGDEGSASFIGKRLVSDYLYGRFPKVLSEDFKNEYGVSKEDVITAVYTKPYANVYLASFAPFAGKWSDHSYIKAIVKEGFDKFIDIHVASFENIDQMPVSFVGSVAKVFDEILTDSLTEKGYRLGQILDKPVNSLVKYHVETLAVLD
ncbi:MAG: glucosamine kinase [Salibacteraceae bacterium]|jgi:N-acetylglucosamine kinase-like BadF-type ATPase